MKLTHHLKSVLSGCLPKDRIQQSVQGISNSAQIPRRIYSLDRDGSQISCKSPYLWPKLHFEIANIVLGPLKC